MSTYNAYADVLCINVGCVHGNILLAVLIDEKCLQSCEINTSNHLNKSPSITIVLLNPLSHKKL